MNNKSEAMDKVAPTYNDDDYPQRDPEEIASVNDPTLFVTEEQFESFQEGELTREELGATDDDKIVTPAQRQSILTEMFSSPSRAEVIDQFVRVGTETVTVRDIADRTELTRQVVYSHIDYLIENNLIVEDREMGNAQTYQLNPRSPLVQLLTMIQTIDDVGRTPLKLDREFLTPHPDGYPTD